MPFTAYMIYGEAREPMTPEEAKKKWGEFKEALKPHNLKMKGPWGPFGVPEGSCFLLMGKGKDFEAYIGSETWQKCPIWKTRTVSLFTPPWAE
jgi:hypothetical protein